MRGGGSGDDRKTIQFGGVGRCEPAARVDERSG